MNALPREHRSSEQQPALLPGLVRRTVRGREEPAAFTYTACYCEENVHRLASSLVELELAGSTQELFAVFISNESKQASGIGKGGEKLLSTPGTKKLGISERVTSRARTTTDCLD
ncbi:hypothetical protein TSOC_006693 [Tetrabaena socialis]|uniref:Protein N-terminal glutamine amidohydrolase alpha beta roll domain-containing protein n=1 Tax=Tetrabaena socialis TaxID=47790 RepID=A0A2J8A304_9CHLO|nr:hypothetical protein TSOC_006693 [Tetrabaena socialis]|eukprot:PNH06901.1 hypothetical protein TSOC_006693 [Tetrabaena socialis]